MKSVALHNLGCKVNAYEIDVMQQMLQEKGYKIVPFDEQADVYIVNTCTVTNIADRKSRQMLHQAKKRNPNAVVVAVGCYVQTGKEAVLQDAGVDLCVGNNRKKDLIPILEAFFEEQDKTIHDTSVIDINHTAEYEEMTLTKTAESLLFQDTATVLFPFHPPGMFLQTLLLILSIHPSAQQLLP